MHYKHTYQIHNAYKTKFDYDPKFIKDPWINY